MKLSPVSLAILAFATTLASSANAADERRSFLVQLNDKPVATYTGEVAGLPATQPPAGQRLNVDATTVQNYIAYLESKQASVLSTVSAANVTHQYNVVFNGFAAMLTDAEVRALKKNPAVANITADTIMHLDTNYTPTFLGLDKPGGLWEQVGGQGAAGEDMIVGIIDSGIWPENPSFADKVDANGFASHSGTTQVYGAPPAKWKGSCAVGEGFTASNCNNKLIGARYFKGANQSLHWTEFLSARDSVAGLEGSGGHGSHTASTAAGNAKVQVVNGGLTLGVVSGMAPRARIAAYKVCWTDNTGRNGCAESNTVAAVEQAVKDGVNVLNFSIGPNAGGGTFTDGTEVAFLGAAAAGVFVAASAGNGGPTSTSVTPTAHLSPWLTSVGNATHNRLFVANAVLGNGAALQGASSNASSASAPLILARDAGLAGVSPSNPNLALCFGPADTSAALLDPAKVSGKILVCDRGSNVLVNKSANGKIAGAAGVIIANVVPTNDTIVNQAHSLSTVHLKVSEATVLKSYMAAAPAAATASLGDLKAILDPTVQAPVMAGGSSRGPNVANANILKPDLSAPGSDILAAVTADLTRAQRDAVAAGGTAPVTDWAFYSGTSMASPHVAGIAALLKQQHPGWSPAAIKSALMTTARTTLPDGRNGAMAWDSSARNTGQLPWAQGAGFVEPSSAVDPGLVYDASEIDWARFLCGINARVYTAATCQAIGTITAYNLNLASLTAANVLGSQTLVRTVRNVGSASATYNVTEAAVPGYTVEVTPQTLTIAAGQKGSFSVKLTRTTAPLATWAYGRLVWSDGVHNVRSPLTVRGTALAAPGLLSSEASTGNKVVTIGTGVSGAIGNVKSGVLPAVQEARLVGQATTDSSLDLATCRAGGGEGVNVHSFSVAPGTLAARWSLFDSDTDGGAASDLDLIVVKPDNTVANSGNAGSNERVQLDAPAPGNYKVCVIGYEPVGGAANYKLSSWLLAPGASNGDFKVLMPTTAFIGKTMSVTMSWQNLAPNVRHLGAVNFMQGATLLGTTMLEVDTDDPVPLAVTARAPAPAVNR